MTTSVHQSQAVYDPHPNQVRGRVVNKGYLVAANDNFSVMFVSTWAKPQLSHMRQLIL